MDREFFEKLASPTLAPRVLQGADVDWLLALSFAVLAGQLAVSAPWEVAIGGAVVLLAMARRRPGLAFVALAIAVLGCARGRSTLDRYEEARARATSEAPGLIETSGEAEVTRAPTEVHGTMRFAARLRRQDDATSRSHSPHPDIDVLLYGGPRDVAQGDRFDVTARLAPPEAFANAGTGDARPAAARRLVTLSGGIVQADRVARGRGILASIDRARSFVRERIEATFPADVAPMARALVLGESDLAPEDDAAFRGSGLAHLLAVSGMHLVLVVAGVLAVLRGVLARISIVAECIDGGRLVAALGPPFAAGYAVFAGGSGSALRAAWMTSAVCFARAINRRGDGVRALALSILAMALVDPLVAFDVSFALSAAATWGLFVLSRPIASRLIAALARLPDRFASRLSFLPRPIAATLAATIPCAPLLARFAPTLPLGGVVANLLAVPLGELAALPLCLAHGLLAKWTDAEIGCASSAAGALRLLRDLASFFAAHATVAVPLPTAGELAVLGALAFVSIELAPVRELESRGPRGPLSSRRWRRLRGALVLVALVALVGLEAQARAAGSPHGELRATFLDVGQGDAALVDLPDGRVMMIDGGGLVGSPVDVGARVILPLLRARRRTRIDVVVLTHPHPDHFLGLVALFAAQGIAIGELWDSGQGEREAIGGSYAALLAEARGRGIPLRRPAELCGVHSIGGATIRVLAPCPGVDPDRDPNDNSLVLRVVYGDRAFLFAGDAEHDEEAKLLAANAKEVAAGEPSFLAADVLKVGHHGSRTSSTPQFLAAVSPSFAVISSGVRNRFGHPHPNTLATLSARHLAPLRTDRLGSITIATDGRSLSLDSLGHPP